MMRTESMVNSPERVLDQVRDDALIESGSQVVGRENPAPQDPEFTFLEKEIFRDLQFSVEPPNIANNDCPSEHPLGWHHPVLIQCAVNQTDPSNPIGRTQVSEFHVGGHLIPLGKEESNQPLDAIEETKFAYMGKHFDGKREMYQAKLYLKEGLREVFQAGHRERRAPFRIEVQVSHQSIGIQTMLNDADVYIDWDMGLKLQRKWPLPVLRACYIYSKYFYMSDSVPENRTRDQENIDLWRGALGM